VDCGDRAADWLRSVVNIENIRLVRQQSCDIDVQRSCIGDQQQRDSKCLILDARPRQPPQPHPISVAVLIIVSGWMLSLSSVTCCCNCCKLFAHPLSAEYIILFHLPPVKAKDVVCNPVVLSVCLSVCKRAFRPHSLAAMAASCSGAATRHALCRHKLLLARATRKPAPGLVGDFSAIYA